MAIKNTYSAESWEKIYAAFQNINFAAYDYDTVKQSLIDYLKLYHKESFNDFIESSELIALLELFAYTAEQLAYRTDMLSHENFITTAQRKQSILKLAKLISYKASRNYPATGVVKLTSIKISEDVIDSLGNNLNNKIIIWNDPNNSNWKEQFLLAMNRVLINRFGQPDKSFQVGDVAMQLYTFNNSLTSFINGVHNFTANSGSETFQMEITPADIDENGIFEKTPDTSNRMSVVYASDGLGDGSDYTGFLLSIKQGTLLKQDISFTAAIPNRMVELAPININQTDVWMNKVDTAGITLERWDNVESIIDQNITYNTNKKRQKFEVETLELDRVKLIFGDGDFSDIPLGNFHVWVRQSANRSLVIQKNRVQDVPFDFSYRSADGIATTCSFTFSLTSTLQNSSASESIEHIRQAAPAAYYAQNRMVNGQDYNTYLLRDPSILRLKTVNRTFAGQPKYIEWNDPSGQYENVKIFGDDLRIEYRFVNTKISVPTSGRGIIDTQLQPLLNEQNVESLLLFISSTYPFNHDLNIAPIIEYAKDAILPIRTKFIEDTRPNIWKDSNAQLIYQTGNGTISCPNGVLKEKTLIQGALDSHWFGEPIAYVAIGNKTYAQIEDPLLITHEDGNIWSPDIPRTIDGVTEYIPGDVGSLRQQVAYFQTFGLKWIPFTRFVGTGQFGVINETAVDLVNSVKINAAPDNDEVWTFVVNADKSTITATSNKRGRLPSLPISTTTGSKIHMSDIFPATPIDFYVAQDVNIPFEAGDSFILKLDTSLIGSGNYYAFSTNELASNYIRKLNCTGYWDIIEGGSVVASNGDPLETTLGFDGSDPSASWVFWIKSFRNSETDSISGFEITYRMLQTTIYSPTTKFWYNDVNPAIDSSTGQVVKDLVRILRSNFPSDIRLSYGFEMDVLNAVYDSNGEPDYHKLETIATEKYEKHVSPDSMIPNVQLMIDSFIPSSDINNFRYWIIQSTTDNIDRLEIYVPVESDFIDINLLPTSILNQFYSWPVDTMVYTIDGVKYGRVKSKSNLDFMWQHFSPYTNMIDPSVTNIHDGYVLTRGYYDNVLSYINGRTAAMPKPPSQLDLRTQYATLMQHKMISDTLILHPGNIKLLFGQLAAPELRGKFRIVMSPSASMTIESVKQETLNVIKQFFSIENWDFGDSFFATELIAAIHTRLATEISSVVLVPTYSVNSFGTLFTINAGITEILQSCATLDDIEIIDSINAITLRQS